MQLGSTSLINGGGGKTGLTPKTKLDVVSDWVWTVIPATRRVHTYQQ